MTPTRSPSATYQLIEAYRSGDSAAAEELLGRYQPYLQKWLRLLTAARWDRRDPEVSHFLSMVGSVDLGNSAQILRQRLRAYEADDLLQEVRITLLATVLRTPNIQGRYRFLLWRRLKELMADPLVFWADRVTPLEEHHASGPDAPELDEAWIAGLTCGAGFDALSERDRRILVLAKWYGHSIARTAEIAGVSKATVDRTLQKAKRLLAVRCLDGKGVLAH